MTGAANHAQTEAIVLSDIRRSASGAKVIGLGTRWPVDDARTRIAQ
jgi:hypothetical protein